MVIGSSTCTEHSVYSCAKNVAGQYSMQFRMHTVCTIKIREIGDEASVWDQGLYIISQMDWKCYLIYPVHGVELRPYVLIMLATILWVPIAQAMQLFLSGLICLCSSHG